MRFGEKLSFLRKQHGMTQLEMAEKLDISRQAVSRWEQGTAEPSTENLVSIGKLFGVPIDDLVNENVQLKAESAVQVVVKDQGSDENTDFLSKSSHTKFSTQVVAVCCVAIISVLAILFYWLKMKFNDQKVNEPVPVNELDRIELDDRISDSFDMGELVE